jgi:hypothetical protein
MRRELSAGMDELTKSQLAGVVGGIRGAKQPGEKTPQQKSQSKPLTESGQQAADPTRAQQLPNISPAPPPPRISAQG